VSEEFDKIFRTLKSNGLVGKHQQAQAKEAHSKDAQQATKDRPAAEKPPAGAAPSPLSEKATIEDEEELKKFLEESKPKILVVGTGGSGSNTITRMREIGIFGAKLVAMNTDAQHLLRVQADKRLLIGKMKTKGLGAGSNPDVGQAAAEESEADIKAMIQDANMVFITCGMGGGTGTGSAYIIARAAKQNAALVVGVVTLPFSSEGPVRMRNALEGFEKLRKEADTTIVIPNDRLLSYVPDLPLNAAFKACDMVLANAVKGITELVTKPGLVNLDFADLKTILQGSGTAMIGLGEVGTLETRDRVVQAAEKALSSPLLEVDLKEANKALINVTGGENLTLGEAEAAVNAIAGKIAKDSHIIWGATVEPELGNAVRVLAVLAGIKHAPFETPQDKDFMDLDSVGF
jgi:cell division protein FtsZ